jgi:hypothetical protein
MAIDSREKRFSMLNFGDGTHVHATFEADASVDLDDRQHLLDLYSGIALASPSTAVLGDSIIPKWYMIKRHSFTRGANRGGRFSR